ncbi:MAG: hypothetical protein EAZ27_12840 [Cytophagales bacterium]|nr:MAG: hypothetical protein EAZ27_12840 [Cytophagales bacterium]
MSIQFIKNQNIDKKKWDFCVLNSENPKIYALSWYLDVLSENWDGLIENDYESVFPLCWKKKYLIKYLYQPIFCQQIGVFTSNKTTSKLSNILINKLKKKYLLINIHLTKESGLEKWTFKKNNLILKLNEEYEILKEKFSKNHKKNIIKATQFNLALIEKEINSDNIHTLLTIFKETYGKHYQGLKDSDYNKLLPLALQANKYERAIIYEVIDNDKTILASSLFFIFNKRIYYLIAAPTNLGRSKNVIYFLINEIIKKYANKGYILDFEGSEIENVAYFYNGFGAIVEEYWFFETHIFKN